MYQWALLKRLFSPTLNLCFHSIVLAICGYIFWLDWSHEARFSDYSSFNPLIKPIWFSTVSELVGMAAMLLWLPLDVSRMRIALAGKKGNEHLERYISGIYSSRSTIKLLPTSGLSVLFLFSYIGLISFSLTSDIFSDRVLHDPLNWWATGYLFISVRSIMRAIQAINIQAGRIENTSLISDYISEALYLSFLMGILVQSILDALTA